MHYKLPQSVLVVIYTGALEVLLLERADHPGFWQSVTGSRAASVEPLVQTCAREVKEETGLDVAPESFVGGPLNTSTATGRREGFIAALKAYRLSVREKLMADCPSFTVQAGAAAARELLAGANRSFTAIVAANDMLALGCYDALSEAGLACPNDISITGYNDMPFADRFNPSLTTLRIPHDQLGVQSSLLLLRKMREPAVTVPSMHLEPVLVVRGSTAAIQR